MQKLFRQNKIKLFMLFSSFITLILIMAILLSVINKNNAISSQNVLITHTDVISPMATTMVASTEIMTPTPNIVTPTMATTRAATSNSINFRVVSGWLPAWDYANAKKSFLSNPTSFSHISPVYYYLLENGEMSAKPVACDVELVKTAHANNVKVMPTMVNPSKESLDIMFNSPQLFNAHQKFLLDEVDKCNYDGLDIDYEKVFEKNKIQYMDMIKDLYTKLKLKNKLLSVFVLPKTGSFDAETRLVQDWKEIAKYSDQIKTFTYDYSTGIAPIKWVEEVIEYGIEQVGEEKLVVGQPLYGAGDGKTYTYTQIKSLISTNSYKIYMDNNLEKVLEKSGTKIYYHDAESIQKRAEIYKKYNIGGITYWRLGNEDPKIYQKIKPIR